ncbi:MAG TPA: hypothetical protein VFZ66_00430 [Herpetosiphonaceae bacterium]
MLRTLAQRLLYAGVLVVIAAVILVGMTLFNQRAAASTSQVTTISLEPARSARVGEAITVRLVVTGARNLAGFQARVQFDSSNLRLVDASAAAELEGTGRDLLALQPVLREGAVSLAAATCPVANCHDTRHARAARINRGIDGRAVLGTLVFYTDQPGRYALSLDGVKLVDPQGSLLAVTTTNAVLDVTAQ